MIYCCQMSLKCLLFLHLLDKRIPLTIVILALPCPLRKTWTETIQRTAAPLRCQRFVGCLDDQKSKRGWRNWERTCIVPCLRPFVTSTLCVGVRHRVGSLWQTGMNQLIQSVCVCVWVWFFFQETLANMTTWRDGKEEEQYYTTGNDCWEKKWWALIW